MFLDFLISNLPQQIITECTSREMDKNNPDTILLQTYISLAVVTRMLIFSLSWDCYLQMICFIVNYLETIVSCHKNDAVKIFCV